MENNLLLDRVNNNIIAQERYCLRLKDSKEPHKIRLQIVIHYFTNGFKKLFTAQTFGTTTKPVRKLIKRCKQYREEGLKDNSRRTYTSPKKPIVKLKSGYRRYGKRPIMGSAKIARVLRKEGITRGGV